MRFFIIAGVVAVLSQIVPASANASGEIGSFREPMTFSHARNGGNRFGCTWISAIGEIATDTPSAFRSFIEENGLAQGEVYLHSPGGNLAAGFELGRIIRELGLKTRVGHTISEMAGGTWFQSVESGECDSACAYAFFGGVHRALGAGDPRSAKSRIGFHQFKSLAAADGGISEAAAITSFSTEQLVSGLIVAYALEMGIDARVLTLSSFAGANEMVFPALQELRALQVVSPDGFGPWILEPYGAGLIVYAENLNEDSLIEQFTVFCKGRDELPTLLITAVNANRSSDKAFGARDTIDIKTPEGKFVVSADRITERVTEGLRYVSARFSRSEFDTMARAGEIEIYFGVARAFGFFSATAVIDDMARQSFAVALRNCV